MDLWVFNVRYLEKVIIFAIMLVVLIYTVLVDLNFFQYRKIPISKQEIPAPPPQHSSENEKSFFPPMESQPEEEGIIEETFTEVP